MLLTCNLLVRMRMCMRMRLIWGRNMRMMMARMMLWVVGRCHLTVRLWLLLALSLGDRAQ